MSATTARRRRLGLAGIVTILAIICIQLAATGNWGSGVERNGTRVKISPVGLTRVRPAYATPPSATVAGCRWWPPGAGDATLCAVAPDADPAFKRIKKAYPLLVIALWVAVGALFLQVLRLPRFASVRAVVTGSAGLLVAVAIVLLVRDAGRALAVFSGVDVRFGALGFTLAILGAILPLVGFILQLGDEKGR